MPQYARRGINESAIRRVNAPLLWTGILACLLMIAMVGAVVNATTSGAHQQERVDNPSAAPVSLIPSSPSPSPSAASQSSASPSPSVASPTASAAAPSPSADAGNSSSAAKPTSQNNAGIGSGSGSGQATNRSVQTIRATTVTASAPGIGAQQQNSQGGSDPTWATYCSRSADGSTVTAYLVVYNAPSSWVATATAQGGATDRTSSSKTWAKSTAVSPGAPVACRFTVNGSPVDAGQVA